jgi:hypothetical protein
MVLGSFLLAASAAAALADPGAIVFHDRVRKSGPVFTLGDVADLTSLPDPLRLRAAPLVLIDGVMERHDRVWSHRMLASRARALMPALGPRLSQPYSGFLHIQAKEQQISASGRNPEAVSIGDAVTTRLRIGIYMIERQGHALQPAKSGERFFVRTSDGVLSAHCCGGER